MSQDLIEKTILVIGGTGSGKSSLINNIALTLRFETLKEAENGAKDFVPIIPVDTEFNKVKIVDGQDENERSDQATSRTRRPQIYRIECGNIIFNLIDTPGMADSEGHQADQEHVKRITTCLYQYKEIHGILAVVKSSENTLNSSLKYTLNLVLSCLGKTAANMISFGITHASHNGNPGAAPNVIRKYLNELRENPGIEYSEDNSYCFESNPLFHVLATKNEFNCDDVDRLFYGLTYKKNVKELLRFFIAVLNRDDCYKVLNMATLILAKQLQPALASLLPYLDEKDEEIKRELDLMEEDLRTKNLEYGQNLPKLKQIRKWKDEYQVTRTRMVNTTIKVKKQRIVEYKDVIDDIGWSILGAVLKFAAAYSWKAVAYFNPELRDLKEAATAAGAFVAGFLGDTEYVDRVVVEEDHEVKRILENIEDERAKIREIKSEKSTLYQKFKQEKQMLLELLLDLTSYLEEHATIGSDDSGLGSSGEAAMDISSYIQKLDISDQWNANPTSTNIAHEELIARLLAIRDLENLGDEIRDIISECENLELIEYQVKDIPLEPNNVFISKVIQGIHQ